MEHDLNESGHGPARLASINPKRKCCWTMPDWWFRARNSLWWIHLSQGLRMFQTVHIVIVVLLQPSVRKWFDSPQLAAISAALCLGTSFGQTVRLAWAMIVGMIYTATACTVHGYISGGSSTIATMIYMPLSQLIIACSLGRLVHHTERKFFIAFSSLYMINSLVEEKFSIIDTWRSVVTVMLGVASGVAASLFPLRVSASFNIQRKGHRTVAAVARLLHVLVRGFISVTDSALPQLASKLPDVVPGERSGRYSKGRYSENPSTTQVISPVLSSPLFGPRTPLSITKKVDQEKAKIRLNDLMNSGFNLMPGEKQELARAAGIMEGYNNPQDAVNALAQSDRTRPETRPGKNISFNDESEVELGFSSLSTLRDSELIMKTLDEQHQQFDQFESETFDTHASAQKSLPTYFSPSHLPKPTNASAEVEDDGLVEGRSKQVRFLQSDNIDLSSNHNLVPNSSVNNVSSNSVDESGGRYQTDFGSPLSDGVTKRTQSFYHSIENFEVTPAPFTRLFIMEANALIERIEADVEDTVAAIPDLAWESFLYRMFNRIFCCSCFKKRSVSRDGLDPEYPPFMSIARQLYAPYSPPSAVRFFSQISAITSNARGMLSALSALERISPSGHSLHVKYVERLRRDLIAVSQDFHCFAIFLISKQTHPAVSMGLSDKEKQEWIDPKNIGRESDQSSKPDSDNTEEPAETIPMSAFTSEDADDTKESNIAILHYNDVMASCSSLWYNYSFLRREVFFPSTMRRFRARLAKQQKAMELALLKTLKELSPEQDIGFDSLQTLDIRAAMNEIDEDNDEFHDDKSKSADATALLDEDGLDVEERIGLSKQAIGKQPYKVQDVLAISHFFFNLDHILSRTLHHIAPICVPVLTDFAHRVSTTPAALAFPDDLPPDLDHLSDSDSAQAQAKVLTSALGVTMGPEFAAAAAGAIKAEKERRSKRKDSESFGVNISPKSIEEDLPPEYADYLWTRRRKHNRLDFTRTPPPPLFSPKEWLTFFSPQPLILLANMIKAFIFPPSDSHTQSVTVTSSDTSQSSKVERDQSPIQANSMLDVSSASLFTRVVRNIKLRCSSSLSQIPHTPADLEYYRFIFKIVFAVFISSIPEFTKKTIFESGAWAPVTVGMIMGDNVGASLTAALQRFLGTVAGAILGYVAIIAALEAGEVDSQNYAVTLGAVLATWAFLMGYLRSSSKHAYTATVAIFTPFIVALGSPSINLSKNLALSRIEMTLFAIIIMVVITFTMWPVRAQTQAFTAISKVLKESITCLELNVYLLEASALASHQADLLASKTKNKIKEMMPNLTYISNSAAARANKSEQKPSLQSLFERPTSAESPKDNNESRDSANTLKSIVSESEKRLDTVIPRNASALSLASSLSNHTNSSIGPVIDPLAQLRQRFLSLFPGAVAPQGAAFMYAFDSAMERRLAEMRGLVRKQKDLAVDAFNEPSLCQQSVHINLLYDAIQAQTALIRVLARMQECIFLHQWLQRHVPKSTFKAAILARKKQEKKVHMQDKSFRRRLAPSDRAGHGSPNPQNEDSTNHFSYDGDSVFHRVNLHSAAFPASPHPEIEQEMESLNGDVSKENNDNSFFGISPFDLHRLGATHEKQQSQSKSGKYPDFVQLALAACKLLVVLLHDVNRQIEVSKASLFTCTRVSSASGDHKVLEKIGNQYVSQKKAASEALKKLENENQMPGRKKNLQLYNQSSAQGNFRRPTELELVTIHNLPNSEADLPKDMEQSAIRDRSVSGSSKTNGKSLCVDMPIIFHFSSKVAISDPTTIAKTITESSSELQTTSFDLTWLPGISPQLLLSDSIQLLYSHDDSAFQQEAASAAAKLVSMSTELQNSLKESHHLTDPSQREAQSPREYSENDSSQKALDDREGAFHSTLHEEPIETSLPQMQIAPDTEGTQPLPVDPAILQRSIAQAALLRSLTGVGSNMTPSLQSSQGGVLPIPLSYEFGVIPLTPPASKEPTISEAQASPDALRRNVANELFPLPLVPLPSPSGRRNLSNQSATLSIDTDKIQSSDQTSTSVPPLPSLFTPMPRPLHLQSNATSNLHSEETNRSKIQNRELSTSSNAPSVAQKLQPESIVQLSSRFAHKMGMSDVAEGLSTTPTLMLSTSVYGTTAVQEARQRARSFALENRPREILGLVWGDREGLDEDEDIWLAKRSPTSPSAVLGTLREEPAPNENASNVQTYPSHFFILKRVESAVSSTQVLGSSFVWEVIDTRDAYNLLNSNKYGKFVYFPSSQVNKIFKEASSSVQMNVSEDTKGQDENEISTESVSLRRAGTVASKEPSAVQRLSGDIDSGEDYVSDKILKAFIQRVDLAAKMDGVDTSVLESVSSPFQAVIYQAEASGQVTAIEFGASFDYNDEHNHLQDSTDPVTTKNLEVDLGLVSRKEKKDDQKVIGRGAAVTQEIRTLALKLDNQSTAAYEWATERIRIGQLFHILSEIVKHYDESCRARISRTHPKGDPMLPSLFLLTEHSFIYSTTALSKVLLDLTIAIRALHLSANVWNN